MSVPRQDARRNTHDARSTVLTLAMLAAVKRLPIEFLQREALCDLPNGRGVGIRYFKINGTELYVKQRNALKAKEGSFLPAGAKQFPYAMNRLDVARRKRTLYLVEGETDCLTLLYHGFGAVGMPGLGAAKYLIAEALEGIDRVYILPKSDPNGPRFISRISARLDSLDFRGHLAVVQMPRGFNDPSDLHVGDPAKFEERFNECVAGAEIIHKARGDAWEPTPNPAMPKPNANGDIAMRPEMAKPIRDLPKWNPFPVGALPDPLADYVREAAIALGCDPAMVALPVLASVAGAIGYTRVVSPKRGWGEPLITWAVVVADSGTLKSPAHDKGVQPIRDFQAAIFAKHKRDLRSFREAEERNEECEEPEDPRIVLVSDTTIEKLVGTLDDNPRGVLLEMDELHLWFNSFARYKGNRGGTDAPQWLSIHRAGPVRYDRKSGEKRRVHVSHAAVSVCGTIQPAILKHAIDGDLLESGMAARLIFAMPPQKPKKWSECEVSEETESRYVELINRLLDLKPQLQNGIALPYILNLDAEAKKKWVDHYGFWAEKQHDAEGPIKAALAKLEGGAIRFAGLHHVCLHFGCISGDDHVPINVDSLQAGITLAKWFAHEAERVLAMLAEDNEQSKTRRLLDWIRGRGGSVSATDLVRSNSRRYPTVASAEQVLDAFVKAGIGRWQDRPTGERGGRPTRDFVLAESSTPNESS